jgi:hypothetical protein
MNREWVPDRLCVFCIFSWCVQMRRLNRVFVQLVVVAVIDDLVVGG